MKSGSLSHRDPIGAKMIARDTANNRWSNWLRRACVVAPWLCVVFITFIVVQPLLGKPPRGADFILH